MELTLHSRLSRKLADGPLKDHVIKRLTEGETPLAIADWLQGDMLEYLQDDRRELAAAIQELFVIEVPLEDRLELLSKGRSAVAKTVAKQRSDRTTLDQLNLLTDLQMGRIDMAHEIEVNLGVPMGSIGNEVELARRLLKDKAALEGKAGTGVQPGSRGALTDEMKAKLGRVLLNLVKAEEAPSVEIIDVESHPISSES